MSDNGKWFRSHEFKTLCVRHEIQQIFNYPYNPRGNGVVERLNSIVATVLRNSLGSKLSELPQQINQRINLLYSRVTGISPYTARFNKDAFNLLQRLDTIKVTISLEKGKLQRLEDSVSYNKKRNDTHFNIHDTVFCRAKNTSKLQPQWIGPGIIITSEGDG